MIATSDGMEVWVINPLENKYSHSFHKDESSRDGKCDMGFSYNNYIFTHDYILVK